MRSPHPLVMLFPLHLVNPSSPCRSQLRHNLATWSLTSHHASWAPRLQPHSPLCCPSNRSSTIQTWAFAPAVPSAWDAPPAVHMFGPCRPLPLSSNVLREAFTNHHLTCLAPSQPHLFYFITLPPLKSVCLFMDFLPLLNINAIRTGTVSISGLFATIFPVSGML